MQILFVSHWDIPLATLFDYFLAENMTVVEGQRVVVPFGAQAGCRCGDGMCRSSTLHAAAERNQGCRANTG